MWRLNARREAPRIRSRLRVGSIRDSAMAGHRARAETFNTDSP